MIYRSSKYQPTSLSPNNQTLIVKGTKTSLSKYDKVLPVKKKQELQDDARKHGRTSGSEPRLHGGHTVYASTMQSFDICTSAKKRHESSRGSGPVLWD